MRHTAIIAAILSLCIAGAASAGEVSGKVYDQRGRPAAGVELAVGDQQAVTGADGSYRFAALADGQHMIEAGSQRVAVQIADDGATVRNIFLMSAAARRTVSGEAVDMESAAAAFAEAIERAEGMVDDGPARGAIAWRWNDHEG